MYGRETRYEPLPLRTPPWMQLEALPVQTCLLHVRQTRRGPPPTTDARRWSHPRWVPDPKVRHDRACASEIPGWRSVHAHASLLQPRPRMTKSPQQSGGVLLACETAASPSLQQWPMHLYSCTPFRMDSFCCPAIKNAAPRSASSRRPCVDAYRFHRAVCI